MTTQADDAAPLATLPHPGGRPRDATREHKDVIASALAAAFAVNHKEISDADVARITNRIVEGGDPEVIFDQSGLPAGLVLIRPAKSAGIESVDRYTQQRLSDRSRKFKFKDGQAAKTSARILFETFLASNSYEAGVIVAELTKRRRIEWSRALIERLRIVAGALHAGDAGYFQDPAEAVRRMRPGASEPRTDRVVQSEVG